MMRALFAGVSGLRNHQIRMDVIGNNIANVNTVAFKASRVTFKEAFAQLVRGASRPPGGVGGINPVQIGLGMNVGSIDQLFTQGNLQSTGQTTDLAIQGDAFFTVSNGVRRFYTRAGNFQLDADGRLIVPTNGFVVQGVVADQSGVLPLGTALSDIIIPFGQKSPARETAEVSLAGNLDAREQPLGSIKRTEDRVYAIEQSTSNAGLGSNINGLFANGDANAQIVGMSADRTTVTVDDGTTTRTYTYVATDTGVGDQAFHSLNDLVAEINNDFATMTAALNNATGAVDVTAVANIDLTLSSSNAIFRSALARADGAVTAGNTTSTDEFSHVAAANDLLTDLRNATGQSLGVTNGASILVDGNVGGGAIGGGSLAVGAATTYQDLLNEIETAFALVNASGAEADTATGALRITGDGGTANELSAINIRVSGGGAANFDSVFDSRPGNYLDEQVATDVTHAASITAFDSIGNPQVLTMTFTKDPTELNRWSWTVDMEAPASITAGGSGFVTFDTDGRLQTFQFDAGANSFQFDPNTGSPQVSIVFDAGTLGDIDGLSQFAAQSNAVASSQDGHPMGDLQDIKIDEQGIITGFFTNGVSQPLARIAVGSFSNPSGLVRRGDNMYEESGNSGGAVVGFIGTSNQSTITPGAVEASNVDLSQEFTSMIIAQRGFQANARVITTSDEMLSELVSLKR